jgi:hypothetical protein
MIIYPTFVKSFSNKSVPSSFFESMLIPTFLAFAGRGPEPLLYSIMFTSEGPTSISNSISHKVQAL